MTNMYQASVPVFIRGFSVMSAELSLAAEFADETGVTEESLINARLAPDMLTLGQQVQRASDTTKNAVARLTGLDAPKFQDTELTFSELHTRIANTVAFFRTFNVTYFENAATRSILLSFSKIKAELSGEEYLYQFVLPNFFFHVATAHDILRHKGIQIGKTDYLGFT